MPLELGLVVYGAVINGPLVWKWSERWKGEKRLARKIIVDMTKSKGGKYCSILDNGSGNTSPFLTQTYIL